MGSSAADRAVRSDAAAVLTTAPGPLDAQERSYADALARLRGAQKSSKGAPAYSLYINRPLGRRFAALAYVLGRTPNQVTALSAVFSFTGIALIAVLPPSWWLGLAVGLCLVVGYALDAADGQLSRLLGSGSAAGEWLDHVVDSAKISSLHLAVAVAVYRFFDLPTVAVLVPLGFTIVANVSFFCQLLNEKLSEVAHLKAGREQPKRVAGAGNGVRALIKIPTDYGVLCLAPLLLGVPVVFYWFYTALFVASAAYLLLASASWFGQMRQLADLRVDAHGTTTGNSTTEVQS